MDLNFSKKRLLILAVTLISIILLILVYFKIPTENKIEHITINELNKSNKIDYNTEIKIYTPDNTDFIHLIADLNGQYLIFNEMNNTKILVPKSLSLIRGNYIFSLSGGQIIETYGSKESSGQLALININITEKTQEYLLSTETQDLTISLDKSGFYSFDSQKEASFFFVIYDDYEYWKYPVKGVPEKSLDYTFITPWGVSLLNLDIGKAKTIVLGPSKITILLQDITFESKEPAKYKSTLKINFSILDKNPMPIIFLKYKL